MLSRFVEVRIDLDRVRHNAMEIGARTKVDVLAVVKADAYGLGAMHVVNALREIVAGYCVFSLDEARSLELKRIGGKRNIAIGPPAVDANAQDYIAAGVSPAVSTAADAQRLAGARPILCVDTGMQRFACPPHQVGAVLFAGAIDEAFTHATRLEQVKAFGELMAGKANRLHAAGSSLLSEPEAWLDAVRPGLAIYSGAMRVTTRLQEVRRSTGPIGYTGWESPGGYHGVIPAGYSNGLRPGPVRINGRTQQITEIGMQSAYVTVEASDHAGDEVELLSEELVAEEVAAASHTSVHQVMVRMAGLGVRRWVNG